MVAADTVRDVSSRPGSFVPALGFDRLTSLYDPVVRITTRERKFKQRLLDQLGLAPGSGCWTSAAAPGRSPSGRRDASPAVVGGARRGGKGPARSSIRAPLSPAIPVTRGLG